MITRPSTLKNIPEEYLLNEEKGLCKVCGKTKELFQKNMKKYCSDTCRWKYQDCFTQWSNIRMKIINRDNDTCQTCKVLFLPVNFRSPLEVDHVVAIVNGGDMWNENNLRTVCKKCHAKKTGEDVKKFNKERKEKELLGLLK